MEEATGEFFVFLDEDDEFYSDHIEQLLAEHFRTNCLAAYATAFEVPTRYADDGRISEEGEYRIGFSRPFSKIELCHANYIPINCILFHRSLYEQCGGFDPQLDYLEDWDLWLRFCTKTERFAFLDKTTALYRVPMERGLDKNRKQLHRGFRGRIRENQNDMYLTMSVTDINKEIDELIDEVTGIQSLLGIKPDYLRAVQRMYRRRLALRMVIYIARPFVRAVLKVLSL